MNKEPRTKEIIESIQELVEELMKLLPYKNIIVFKSEQPKHRIVRDKRNNTQTSIEVAHLIRNYREELGINQKDLAEKVEVTPQAISHYEAARRTPGFPTMEKIARTLSIPKEEWTEYYNNGLSLEEITSDEIKIKSYYRFLGEHHSAISNLRNLESRFL